MFSSEYKNRICYLKELNELRGKKNTDTLINILMFACFFDFPKYIRNY